MVGVPPLVSTSTASLKVTLTPTFSPSVQVPSSPAPLSTGVSVTVGGSAASWLPLDGHARMSVSVESVNSMHRLRWLSQRLVPAMPARAAR